jgi:nucleoside-diphosphate-sugar epimerase
MWHLTNQAQRGGAIRYAGSLDLLHSWAYLPDLAATFVRLAERRSELEPFAVFHFEGHVVDGHGFVRAVRSALGDPDRRVRSFPWLWLQPVRLFVPMVRELFEMRYLWDEPVRMDGSKLRAFLGDVPHTPFDVAIARSLAGEELGADVPGLDQRVEVGPDPAHVTGEL